jgi:hypothetical protein
MTDAPPNCVVLMSLNRLAECLERAAAGEDPDLIMLDLYANSNREHIV